jgi:hypothetical protein
VAVVVSMMRARGSDSGVVSIFYFALLLKLSLSPMIGHKKTAKRRKGQRRGVDFCRHQSQFIKGVEISGAKP